MLKPHEKSLTHEPGHHERAAYQQMLIETGFEPILEPLPPWHFRLKIGPRPVPERSYRRSSIARGRLLYEGTAGTIIIDINTGRG
jgi:hypothetical protein